MMVRRMAAAILAVDAWSGLPITDGSIRIRTASGAVPVRKEGGWYVLWEEREPFLTYRAEAWGYETEVIILDIEEMRQRKSLVYYLYLIPSQDYLFPYGWHMLPGRVMGTESEEPDKPLECLAGIRKVLAWPELCGKEKGSRYKRLWVTWPQTEDILYLNAEYRSDGPEAGQISLRVPDGLFMEGRWLYLRDSTTGGGAICRVRETADRKKGIFYLENNLELSFSIRNTVVSLLYRSAVDRDGNFQIPLWKSALEC